MPNREIIAIEIDDSAFQEFQRKFNEHQEILKNIPTHWVAASEEIEKQKTSFEKLTASLSSARDASLGIEKAQGDLGKLLDGAAISLGLLGTQGKLFAHNIWHSTQHLAKWTKLTSVFAGIIGAGGLFGIDRMAASVAAQRTSAMGLGISYTEQASFLTNFRALGLDEETLKGFSNALATPIGKAQIGHLLGHAPSGDAAETAAEAILKFKDYVESTPDEQLAPRLKALGYTDIGLGVEQAKAIRGIPREELEARVKAYREGKTSALALDPGMAKKWTEFTTQMEFAGKEVGTAFVKGFVNLAKPLEDLSNSFIDLVENLMRDGGPLKGWVDSLGDALTKLVKTMSGKEFEKGVTDFIHVSTEIVHHIERITSMSLKEILADMRRGMDESRSDIERRYGKDWNWHSGFTGPTPPTPPGGDVTTDQGRTPTPERPYKLSRPEDIYKPGEGGLTSHQRAAAEQGGSPPTRQSVSPATPSQNERAATEGTGARTQTPGGPGSPGTPGDPQVEQVSFTDSEGLPTVTAVGGKAPKAFIAHWTGGMGDIASVEKTLRERHLGVEYIMDREGHIKKTGGPGSQQIRDESDPKWGTELGQRLGLNSANTVGMEVIGDPQHGYTQAQIESFKKFMQAHYPDTPVYGHGEVQRNKMPAEGLDLANAVRKDRATRHHGQRESRLSNIGKHPVDVALMHRRPEVEIAMEGSGRWAVS